MRQTILVALVIMTAWLIVPLRAEGPATQPAGEKPKKLRVIKPYAELASLTDDQRQQIGEIHADYVEKLRALQEWEEQSIMAILSEAQKAELEQMLGEQRAARKQKASERKAAKDAPPSTQPSGK